MQSTRLPRFRRSPEIGPISLTDRDRDLIQRASQHRFLRSSHFLSLTSGSRQQVLRRLQRLYHHGYLDRPLAQIDLYRAGSQPMVYALGNKGMRFLENEYALPHRKLDWPARNRNLTRFFMEHALAVADVMVKMETCCREHNLELVRVKHGKVLHWSVPIRGNAATANVGVIPDALFGIKSQEEIRWFFLESDRATMPIERSNLKQTSFFRKLLAYHETWRQKVLQDSLPRFQVLTVTTTPAHVENMLRANQRINRGKGLGLLLFTDRDSFNSAQDVLQLPLVNGRGEKVTLWQ